MNYQDKIEAMLEKVQKAPRYTGGEMNTAIKPWEAAKLHFAFCFPDTYEVGMSHLGMKILYGAINAQPDMLCERLFMPWVDMKTLMEEENVPLFSMENRRALNEFDVVGFTLQYEMSYTNVLAMLKLGNIPLLREERAEDAPIIVAGGPCAFNPEPLADFIDAFMVGDGEEQIIELNRVIMEGRAEGASRMTILKRLAGVRGVYVPALYDVAYNEDGTIASMKPNCAEAPEKVLKAIITDMDSAYFPKEIPVPYTEIIHDRIMLEIMRGCTRGCRFCQAGMLYRPVRERSLEKLVELAEALEKSTGYDEISLSSLSSGDYTCLAELIRELIRRLKEKRVSISLPSLRLDSILKDALEETQKERKTSLTFAPEAGTQRLRDVINKGVTEDDLIGKVKDAFEGGWSSVKLYFMMGLPTETYEDLDGIADLADTVVKQYFAVPKTQRAKGLRVTCSASVFVPKPFTPFQWEPQDTQEIVKAKQQHVRDKFKAIKGANFNYHESDLSYLEACFARGDRKMGKVLLRAFEKGCILDGWGELFNYEAWREAFEETGIDPAFYAFRRREKDEILPWDHIDCGVTKEFLWREKEKADKAMTTKDCRQGCNGCGLQRYKGVCSFCG